MSDSVERRFRRALGTLALLAVPVAVVAVPVVPVVALLGPSGVRAVPVGVPAGLLAAGVVGLVGSTALGPVLFDRRVARLPEAELDDRPADRIEAIAADVGVDAPATTVVRADAANVAVADGYRGARLVVSTRLLALPRADRDAAIRHALARIRTREAALTTAVLPALAAVETVALLATLLVGRRSDRTDDQRVNRIHGYEPDRERVPPTAYAVAGACCLVPLLLAWGPAALGDRLAVSGGRRRADALVARAGQTERDGLGNAVAFAGEAAGATEWPPLFDRLSLVSMADAETGRVRGTSRQEARIRLARLRSKRAL